MTHAKDRTLLASLGFADPDKKEPRHDLACRYLARADVAEKGLRAFGAGWAADSDFTEQRMAAESMKCPHDSYSHKVVISVSGTRSEKTRFRGSDLEVPVFKGQGQYRSMIGFLDCVLSYEVTSAVLRAKRSRFCRENGYGSVVGNSSPLPDNDVSLGTGLGMVFVEVKIRPTPIGDVLRQIKLYREFTNSPDVLQQLKAYREFTADCEKVHRVRREQPWVLAVDYDVSSSERQAFASEGVSVVRLGPGFKKFVEEEGQMGHDVDVPEL